MVPDSVLQQPGEVVQASTRSAANRSAWWGRAAWSASVLVAVIALGSLLPSYQLFILTLAGIWAIAAIGLNLLTGFAGQVSIGHAGFMAIGAYGAAVAAVRLGWPFWVAVPAAGLLSAVLGGLLALPALRLRGPYLAIATLAFGVVVAEVLRIWAPVTGGYMGLQLPQPTIGPWVIAHDADYFLLTVALLALAYGAAARLAGSSVGRAWLALRDREEAAQAAGISRTRYRTLAFVESAAYAGVAGALLAYRVGRVDPDALGLAQSIFLITAVIIGGLASVPGAVLGAVLLTVVFHLLAGWGTALGWTTQVGDVRNILYGVLLVVATVLLPGGLWRLPGVLGGRGSRSLRASFKPWSAPLDTPTVEATSPGSQQPTGTRDGPAGAPPPVAESAAPARGVDTTTARTRPPSRDGLARERLEIAGVSKRFGGLQALDRVEFSVEPGQIVGLIGPNGAGKTTLLNIISRFVEPDEGSIRFAGHELRRASPHDIIGLGIARTFQGAEVFPALTVLDNLLVGQHALIRPRMASMLIGWPSAVRDEQRHREQAWAVLQWLGLSHLAFRSAGELSFGERKWIEFGRALVARPRLLLLDEPAGGLHPVERRRLRIFLQEARRTYGCSILLIEHDMGVVMDVCDRVVVLNFGRRIAEGPPTAVANDAGVIEAYLGERPTAGTSGPRSETDDGWR